MKLKLSNKNGKIALAEIAILVISIVAFAYILSGSFGVVSAYVGGLSASPFVSKGLTGATTATVPVAPPATAAGLGAGVIFSTFITASTIFFGTKWILSSFGVNGNVQNSAAYATTGGYIAATAYSRIFGDIAGKGLLAKMGLASGWATLGVGLAVTAIILGFTLKNTKYETYSFTCQPWSAAKGGDNCELCNQGDLPCTEYRCESLGQACELVNQGTGQEKCVWADRGVTPAIIEAWDDILTPGYKYTPDNAVSPPDRGVKIVSENNPNGCLKPFEAIRFGVQLDKPATCKIDTDNRANFDSMKWSMGSTLSLYTHSQTLSFKSKEALDSENITYNLGEEKSLFVKCEDVNENQNDANFVFTFCVDDGPDTSAPVIVTTSIINGMPISSNQSSVDLDVYVNEPAECKWSRTDLDYDNMENDMSCVTAASQSSIINGAQVYKCSTTLTGLKDRMDNDFYFRCKDKPWLTSPEDESERYADTTSCIFKDNPNLCKFTLVGTQPLVILSVGPDNETISDSTSVVKVTLEAETTAGFNKGDALCSYSPSGEDGSYIEFYPETGSYTHSQDLYLIEGDYEYYIRCTDLGGNTDTEMVSFTVETDVFSPNAVRVFKDGTSLKIITDEKASCVYDSVSCTYDFDLGIKMSTDSQGITHSTTWNANKNLYIKCQDEYENRPGPDQCSIIARPFEV
ncbi:MAG: hypothetical protein KJ879_01085 [Nanoarchaeota archaeon]|nr:hypothetical protein [Nanoarchaeota archaeon]